MLTNAIYPFVAVVGQEQLKKSAADRFSKSKGRWPFDWR